jgi:hypothetical protein
MAYNKTSKPVTDASHHIGHGQSERTDKSMNTLSCPECKREFSHENPVVAARALARHRGFEHGVISETQIKEIERKKRREARKAAALAPLGGSATPAGGPPVELSAHDKIIQSKRRYYERNRTKILARKKAYNDKLRVKVRSNLQSTSWWKVEGTRPDEEGTRPDEITCPCCGSVFAIIERKGQ